MSAPKIHYHPILGELRYDAEEEFWLGTIPLPQFANYGRAVAEDFARFKTPEILTEVVQFEEGIFHALVYTVGGNTPSMAQNEAFDNLLQNEDEVVAAVLGELASAFEAESIGALRDQAWLRQIEAADEEEDGIAYLGFTFSSAAMEESPTCVIYHPEKGTWWAESSFFEALDLGLGGAEDAE